MNAEAPGARLPDNPPPDNPLPDNLPVLIQVVEPDELPMLTEVVAPEPLPSAPELSEEEIQLLLKQIEERIEAVFMQKLNLNLEKLQRLAVKQAASEFRAALPQLLRDIRKR